MRKLLRLAALVVAARAALGALPSLAAGAAWLASRLREAADLVAQATRFLSALA